MLIERYDDEADIKAARVALARDSGIRFPMAEVHKMVPQKRTRAKGR